MANEQPGFVALKRSQTSPRPAMSAPESPDIPPLTVYTLGKFAVWRGDQPIEDGAWKRRKAKSLFKMLLLSPGRQLLKDYVLGLLWPEQDADSAANNLHRTLFVLRHALQPELGESAPSRYILVEHGAIMFNPAVSIWVDAEEFERSVQTGRQQPDPLPSYEIARELYQGDFLPEDIYEDWAGSRRESLQSSYVELLHDMAHLYYQRSAYGEATGCLQRLIQVDPTNEEGHRDLMRLYTLAGHRHQAIRQYQRARQLLKRELDVDPSPETTELYRAIVENRWRPAAETANYLHVSPASPLLGSHSRPPLIGRETEMLRLEELLDQLKTGRGSVVFLCGEPGVGKSRIAEEVTARAGEHGMRVLFGAAYEQEGRLPYGPFVGAIRNGLAGRTPHEIHDMLGVAVNDLARLLPELASPELARLLPELSPLGTARPAPELDVGQERQRLFDAVVSVFVAIASTSPVVVFLDDLHAADESSLQMLHYLARQLAEHPVFFLCALREDDVPRGTPMARLFSELLRSKLTQRFNLSRLDPSAVAAMAASLLGGGKVAPELNDALYQLTEGNSFYVHEVVLALMEAGKLERVGDVWRLSPGETLFVPASVREVIGLRLESVSTEANRLAALASVVGREFRYDLLRAASQLEDGALLDLVDELLKARLFEETSNGYRFCHSLIRHVVYDGLSARRRAWLHNQVAQALERLFAHHLDEQAAILAHHYERAESYAAALNYLTRAGDRARSTNAPREAAEQYDRALALCYQQDDLASPETTSLLHERRAQAFIALSNFDAAISDLEQLLESSRKTGDRRREGEALYQVGIAHYWAHRLQPAASYLDQAIQMAQLLGDDALAAKAFKLRDILNSTRGGPAHAASVEAMGSRDSAGNSPAEEHWGLALLAYLRSDFEIAIQHAQACVDIGRSFPNPFLVLGGYFVLSVSQASLGNHQVALDHLLPALSMSESAGERFWRARLLNTVGWVYRELFDLNRAIQFDQASLDLARAGDPRLTEAEGNALANLAADYLQVGDGKRTRDYLDEGLKGYQDEQFMRWRYWMRMIVIRGWLDLAEGNQDGAMAAADESLGLARGTQAHKIIAQCCRLRGEVLLSAGSFGQARTALRHALDTGLNIKSPSLVWPCHASLARLEETAGQADAARVHYRNAADLLQRMAGGLTDASLRQSFLTAPEARHILQKAT